MRKVIGAIRLAARHAIRCPDRQLRPLRLLATALAVCLAGTAVAQTEQPSKEPGDFLTQPPKPSTLQGDFKLMAVGELLYSRPLADWDDPELQKVFSLVRTGDVSFGHQESVFFDLETFTGEGYSDGLLWGEAALAEDVKAIGIDMVALASNHSTDWGVEGLMEMSRLFDEEGIMHAGGGMTMREARGAGYLDTPQGRIALISTASTFKPNARANDPFAQVPARGGISTLRTRKINLVTEDRLEQVRQLATELASPRQPAPEPDTDEIRFGEEIYRLSDRNGLTYEMDLFDHAALLQAIREAKDKADFVAFSIHAHESPTGMDDDAPDPPDFLVKLFHNAVDAGADVIIGTGQHSLRGIEIYKGTPVFYGMGAFFIRGEILVLQETAYRVFPDRTGHAPPPEPETKSVRKGGNPASWYDSIVAEMEYKDGKASVVRLYPLDTGNTYNRSRRGIPYLAEPEYARRILSNLQESSRQFGTEISIENSIGIIRIP